MAVGAQARRLDMGRILDAAGRVFVRQGYADTSLRQLMAAARVSTTAFYARFESKEDVLRALVRRLLDELDVRTRSELAHAEGLDDGFRRGVEALVAVLGPNRELVRLALTEAAASSDVTDALGTTYAAIAGLLASQMSLLVERGAITTVDPEAMAWSLVGALHMQILRWAVYRQLETAALVPALHAVASTHLPALRSLSGSRRPRRRAASWE